MKYNKSKEKDHINLSEYQITETYTLSEEYQEQGTAEGEKFYLFEVLDRDEMEYMTLADLYESRVRYFVEEVVQNNSYDEEDIYHDRGAWTDDEWVVHAVDVNLYIDLYGQKYRLPCSYEYLTDAVIERGVNENGSKRISVASA